MMANHYCMKHPCPLCYPPAVADSWTELAMASRLDQANERLAAANARIAEALDERDKVEHECGRLLTRAETAEARITELEAIAEKAQAPEKRLREAFQRYKILRNMKMQ